MKGLLNGVLGDLVEHHPVDVRPAVLLALQLLLQVRADGFPFAVRVGCQIDGFDAFGGLFQLTEQLAFAFDDFIARFEAVLDIHGQVFLGEILDMAQRRFDDVLLTQIFIDGFRLNWRFHDYESFRHKRTSTTFHQISQRLPHFHKILSRKLLDQSQHFQFEKRGDHLGSGRIFHNLKEIIQMYGSIHLQDGKQLAANFG